MYNFVSRKPTDPLLHVYRIYAYIIYIHIYTYIIYMYNIYKYIICIIFLSCNIHSAVSQWVFKEHTHTHIYIYIYIYII